MKSVTPSEPKKGDSASRTIERPLKRTPLETVRDNVAASRSTDYKKGGIEEYMKCATDAGIVAEVKGKEVASFYMVNVSLEKRVFNITLKKRRVSKVKKHRCRCKVNKSSFDRRNNRSSSELLYI